MVLFYKPDSNPSRFSKEERFSLHLTSTSAPDIACQIGDEDCLSSNRIAASSKFSARSHHRFACDNNACERPSGDGLYSLSKKLMP